MGLLPRDDHFPPGPLLLEWAVPSGVCPASVELHWDLFPGAPPAFSTLSVALPHSPPPCLRCLGREHGVDLPRPARAHSS